VLALDYSGARSRRHPIMAAMTTAMITPRMPGHPRLRFGIGAIPTKAITPRYLNVRFRGEQLFSSQVKLCPYRVGVKPLCGLLNSRSDLTRQASVIGDVPQVRTTSQAACTLA
jgi:hypothetical protein